VCQNNASALVDKLVENLNLQALLDTFNSQTAQPSVNWTQLLAQSQELQQGIEQLVHNPPSFNPQSLLDALQRDFNTSDLWRVGRVCWCKGISSKTELSIVLF
jgi:hypothetical protein